MKNKAQTAMEYLMTYGWAILIIIVVVAALYSLGVFSVKPAVACSPCFSYFAFMDYTKELAGACAAPGCLYIRNGARTVQMGTLSVTSNPAGAASADCALDNCDAGEDIEVTAIPTTGDVDIEITFIDDSTGVQHKDTATVHNL